jgi:F-type H+-transporting ATPase subunit delta
MLWQAVRNQIAEAQKIAGGSGSEADIAEAKIELEVCFFAYTKQV